MKKDSFESSGNRWFDVMLKKYRKISAEKITEVRERQYFTKPSLKKHQHRMSVIKRNREIA